VPGAGQSCRARPSPETVKLVNNDHEPVAAAPPCPALSFLTLVEKQNSHNRMTLKFVEDLYLGTQECGVA